MSLLLLSALLGAAPTSYVIVVGNNASPALGRPRLAYADDDALRYEAVFHAALAEPVVDVLTTLDADTQRQFPDRATPPAPTRAALDAAFERMRGWSATERRAGRRTRGYFVFAGHGDVERGEGFVELEDGRLSSSALSALLAKAGPDEVNVVLDSCNAFYVLSPRKPGGKVFPTPADATEALAKQLPSVGVLLATSAEAEVYEWSELQSGIFSYLVRSGLLGAADANVDGELSFEELASFATNAAGSLVNPALRPRIFARGPTGDVRRTFATLRPAGPATLTHDGGEVVRVRLKDALGVRWADAHVAGQALVLRLPSAVQVGGVVERLVAKAWGSAGLTPDTEPSLSKLAFGAGPSVTARSQAELGGLFEAAWGTAQVDAWRTDDAARAQTPLAVSEASVERVEAMLRSAAERDREGRKAGMFAFGGSLLGSATALGLSFGFMDADNRANQAIIGAVNVASAVAGLTVLALAQTTWERVYAQFSEARRRGDTLRAVADLDAVLQQQVAAGRTARVVGGVLAGVGLALSAATFVLAGFAPNDDARAFSVAFGTLGMTGFGFALGVAVFGKDPIDDVARMLLEERNSQRPRVSIAPVNQGAVLRVAAGF